MSGQQYVSTGTLPTPDLVESLVAEAFALFRSGRGGAVSQVYPALARVSPDRFGISVVATAGTAYEAGDAQVLFPIMSVAKPFVFALVSEAIGGEEVRRRIGVNATGRAFNSLDAVEDSPDGRTNPMVNAGAIATTSLVSGNTLAERWRVIQEGLSRFAGRRLEIDAEVYTSASETNEQNREIVRLLERRDRVHGPAADALDLYTRQSSLGVSAHDLAVMGATLADGGVNPFTRDRIVGEITCRHTLAVMATAGLYETSGDWLFDVGLPGKSGIGGGIVTVAPGKGAVGTFAPLLDDAGNSLKGQLVTRYLARRLGLDLFVSEPSTP